LKDLEANQAKAPELITNQLTLFGGTAQEIPDYLTSLEHDLKALDVMNLTPLQALQKLHDLRTQVINH
jgi:hypothetical protein